MTQSEIRSINGREISDNYARRQLAEKVNKNEITNSVSPKGTKSYASLPQTGNLVGDYYYCPDGNSRDGAGNYVWNGSSWFFGGTGDEGYTKLNEIITETGIKKNIILGNLNVGYIYENGTINPSSSYNYTDPITLKKGYTVKWYAKMYGNHPIILKCENGIYTKLVSCENGTLKTYEYINGDNDIQIVLVFDNRQEHNGYFIINNFESIVSMFPSTEIQLDTSTEVNVGYIYTNGTINPSPYYNYTNPIFVEKGDTITFNARGYNTSFSMISKYENGNFINLVSALDGNINKYTYVCDSDMWVVLSFDTRQMHLATLTLKDTSMVKKRDVKNIINNSISEKTKIDVVFPSKTFAVVGHEYNLYYQNVINTKNINDYFIYCSIDGLTNYQNYNNCFRITPAESDIGEHTMHYYVKNKMTNETIIEKTCIIHIIPEKQITGKNVLFIGDSLTESGYYPAEIQRLSNNGMISIGTCSTTVNIDNVEYTVKHEGHSGWSAYDFLEKTDSPFLNSLNKFDFEHYITSNNLGIPDIVCLNLGTNGVAHLDKTINALDSMIINIHAYNPNIIVLISLITPPASQDGWIHTTSPSINFNVARFALLKKYIEKYQDRSDKVDVTEVMFGIDTVYDFPTITERVSARNPLQIERVNNTVHPLKYGYFHMADNYYNNLLYYFTKN